VAEIEAVQVRGLRASGTNYMDSLLSTNFPSIQVNRTLFGAGQDDYGWKHGALGSEIHEYIDGAYIVSDGDEYVRLENSEEIFRVGKDDSRYVGADSEGDIFVRNNVIPVTAATLLVVVHRNPLKWLQSMQRQPHHAPKLYGFNMSAFIRNPWQTCYTSPYGDASHDPAERQKWIDKSKRIGETIIEDEASVFDHRANSIRLFELLRSQAPNVLYINYEQLRSETAVCLGRLALLFDMPTSRTFKQSATYKGNGSVPFIEQKYQPFSKRDLLHIMRSIDWEAEAIAGYEPIHDFSKETDPEVIPDEACEYPTRLIRFMLRVRSYLT
jgi:hypothetical protein